MARIQLQPAKKERLSDILYGQLIQQIASPSFAEGDQLPSEAEICASFGVSRPIVRQALARLRADGILVSQQGAGTFVKRKPPSQIFEVARAGDISEYLSSLEARIIVEPEAAAKAAQRRSRAALARIETALDAIEREVLAQRPAADLDFTFHAAIVEASGNAFLVEFMAVIRSQVLGQMNMALGLTRIGSSARREDVMEEHRRIVRAIADSDSEAAATFMRYHLMQARMRTTDAKRLT